MSIVRQADRISGHLDWREPSDHADRLADLAGLSDERIADGDPKLVEILEEDIAFAHEPLRHIDDPNGSTMPAILRLLAVHEHACSSLHAAPLSLEERLYRFQLTGDWDTFRSVLAANESTLGQSGLDRYQELVEAA